MCQALWQCYTLSMKRLHLRPYVDQDLNTLFSIKQESVNRNKVDPLSTLESVPTKEEFFASLDAQINSSLAVYVAEQENEIVGYGRISWWNEDNGTLVYLLDSLIAPQHLHDELDLELIHLLKAEISKLAKSRGDAQKIVIGINESGENDRRLGILYKEGFVSVWKLVEMELTDFRSLPKPIIADGFEIKLAESKDFHRIYEANNAVYAGVFGYVPMSDYDYEDFLYDNSRYKFWSVVWHGDELAGFILSHIAKGRGAVKEVTILPEFRRKGLAKALLITNLKLLGKAGVTMVRLHTDAEGKSGARQLYEQIGFSPLKTHYRLRKKIK